MKKIRLIISRIFPKRLFLKVRLLFFVILLLPDPAAAVSSGVPETKISLHLRSLPLREALEAIERQTDYKFIYKQDIPLSVPVTIDIENGTLAEVLGRMLPEGYRFNVNGNQVAMLYTPRPPQPRYGTVTGVVKDAQGKSLVGVTLVVRGTNRGTTSDANGLFRIVRVPAGNSVIEARYIGYESRNVPLNGLRENEERRIEITLREGIEISDVVVTALGITREEKSLGYSADRLMQDEFTAATHNNWVAGLAGKVAGLNFDQSSQGPGGSIRVTLRGEGSLTHQNNEALFVVDGVPISSSMTASTSSGGYGDADAPIDFGNGISDLNPDDIESVNVLKGPAATALYGSRAAAGAVIVSTKSGRQSKGFGVSVNSSVAIEQAGFWPDFQTEYGAGDFRRSTTGLTEVTPPEYNFWTAGDKKRRTSRYAFGARYDGSPRMLYGSRNWDTDEYTLLPYVYQDWYKGFFRTGVTYTNQISLDGNNGKGTSIRTTYRDVRSDWILPNTGYDSQNIYVSVHHVLNPHIKLGAKVTYFRKHSDNLPMSGYNTASPVYSLIWTPSTISVRDYESEYRHGIIDRVREQGLSTSLLINGESDNPYFQLYEHINTFARDRVYGNVNAEIAFIPNILTLTLRSGMDLNSEFRTQRKPYYSNGYMQGFYREQEVYGFEMNNDFLLTWKGYFNDFSLTASVGGNNMYNEFRNIQTTAAKLIEPGYYSLRNCDGMLQHNPYKRKRSINSFYGFVSATWRGIVFLELTGRNDWSSTLAPGNNSYFYPSVNTSILLDELFATHDRAPWLDMLKVRASWANVGNDTDPYRLEQVYSNSDFAGGYKLSSTIQEYNIRPENVESWEVGLEARMLRNRLNLDVTWYSTATTDQIVNVPSDYAIGASSRIINAGKVTNKGIEIALRADPVKTEHWRWTIQANWSANRNKLVELAPGVEMWQLNTRNTVGNRVFVYSYPGMELGHIFGTGYKRAPAGAYYTDAEGRKVDCAGQVIVDAATGNPVLTSDDELYDFGSIYPKWKAGLTQSIRFRNLTLSMTFQGQWGGHAYSMTNMGLSYMGKLTNSLPGRYDGLIHPGVNLNEDGTYQPNTRITTDIVDYYNSVVYNRNNVETNTFSTSYLKMKECRISFRLPEKLCRKTRFLQSAEIGVWATNLFCLTEWPAYDPEVAAFGGNSLSKGVEPGAYPMTRTYGLNVKLSF
ncbi:SusC/RagA family TonB-linked outer membrane protein [Alistipes sp.]|uniref:SusC/RagA family TonB-linked outer membrane protein n=1 Tax=Alistipes sp. TaxID=1872444 RepID=UPI003AF06B51